MRLTGLVGLLGLTGCPASVTAEGIDEGFGMAFGAAWIHTDAGEEESDSIVIANYGDICPKYEAYYQAYSEFEDSALDVLSKDYCENIEEPFLAWIDAAAAIGFDGAKIVSISFLGDLNDKEYDFDDDAYGSVSEVSDAPWEDFANDFDTDGDITDGCGIGTMDTDYGDVWSLTDGSVEITALADEASASGTVDARMQDTGKGDDKSGFTASFGAGWCEINL